MKTWTLPDLIFPAVSLFLLFIVIPLVGENSMVLVVQLATGSILLLLVFIGIILTKEHDVIYEEIKRGKQ